MSHRLFFALNFNGWMAHETEALAEELRRTLGARIRIIPPENWHITVSFLGVQEDGQFTGIMRAAQSAAKRFKPIRIDFERIQCGPRQDDPRMLWLAADDASSGRIGLLKQALEDGLVAERVPFHRETRPFRGHITLVRFGEDELHTGNQLKILKFDEPLNLNFIAESLDLMESSLTSSGSEYVVLQKFMFEQAEREKQHLSK